jgi:hypothetical protein
MHDLAIFFPLADSAEGQRITCGLPRAEGYSVMCGARIWGHTGVFAEQ